MSEEQAAKGNKYIYEFYYDDFEDGNKEKVAVTLETPVKLDDKHLNFQASFYNDMYDLNHVKWREVNANE